ncbi:protein of unknown function (plasmid) [Cupriavidus taiwanensis]|uniref:Uncharacterized protein n=1 Tax=Cupriavidus taiwanensis TaxID=164546 RepID=A0A375IN07_9BURK|nr:protein of unknown function [Cupriavidus taiwanensis]
MQYGVQARPVTPEPGNGGRRGLTSRYRVRFGVCEFARTSTAGMRKTTTSSACRYP